MKVKRQGQPDDSAWTEPYEINGVRNRQAAERWANETLTRFNSSLRKGEAARELVGLEVIGDDGIDSRPQHTWEKSNAMTLIKAGRTYDEYRCKVCGVTGKQFQLDSGIVRDTKYRSRIYARCDTALEHITKLGIAAMIRTKRKRDAEKKAKGQ